MTPEVFADYPKHVLERFKNFHRRNPDVYRKFEAKAQQMAATGRKKYSARTIIEAMRWEYDLTTTGDVFKVNGDFVPIYCRLLAWHHAKFETFFEFRKVRSRGVFSHEQRKRELRLQSGSDVG